MPSNNMAQREFLLANNRKVQGIMLPSPDFFFFVFDLTMIFAFIGGWSFTMLYNWHVLDDNPILRAFEANNICVGVDKGGARIAANVLWGVMLIPLACYLFTTYLQLMLWEENAMRRKIDITIMCLAYLMLMTFGLCFGIEPQWDGKNEDTVAHSVMSVKVHTWGFCIALVGYALTRIVEIRSFIGGYMTLRIELTAWKLPKDPSGRKYVFSLWVHFLWCAGGVIPLFKTLVFDDLSVYLQKTPKTGAELWLAPMSIVMWIWSIGILALPIITWWLSDKTGEAETFQMHAIPTHALAEEGSPMYP